MRIVITRRTALDVPDGINISSFSLAQALIGMGHQVAMVSATRVDPARIRELYTMPAYPRLVALTPARSPRESKPFLAASWLLLGKRAIARLAPDLVIVNGSLPYALDAPTCVVSHDLEQRFATLGPMRTWYKRLSYRNAHFIVTTCSELGPRLARELAVREDRIRIIPTCFDLTAYRPEPISARTDAILHMGTVDYKNPAATLRAFALTRSATATLFITGAVDEHLSDEVARLPASYRSRVELLGFVSAERLRHLLRTARVVSVPSTYATPVASPTAIEALASGTPVVASPSISRDVVADGVNGYVSASGDPGEIAEHFDRLLSDDRRWAELSVGAVQSVRQFAAESVARAYLGLLDDSRAGARHQ